VSSRHSTPAPAIWLCIAIAFAATISSGTYAVVTSLSVIGLYFSYIIPVYLAFRLRGTTGEAPRGPWHLGRFGYAVNMIAIVWVVFICGVLTIPDGMRAGKTVAAVTFVLAVWYGVFERHRFRGPAWTAGAADQVPLTRAL
jgi:amino acid transporter